jgi:hypothetical protein
MTYPADASGAAFDTIVPTEFRLLPVWLHFNISLNEEHALLHVSSQQCSVDLGERVHHYCLLTLARLRLLDAGRGVDATEQGWVHVDRLQRMLGIDACYLNIQIFRARKQLAEVASRCGCPCDPVERRRGMVRWGRLGFDIHRGLMLEGRFDPVFDSRGDALNSADCPRRAA